MTRLVVRLGHLASFFVLQVIVTGPTNPFPAGQIVYLGVRTGPFQQPEGSGISGFIAVFGVRLDDLGHLVIGVIEIAKNDTGVGVCIK